MAATETPAEKGTLEARIVGLATSGRLGRVGRRAVRSQKAAGLPVTYQRGNQIIREQPDGTVEVLATIPSVAYKVPDGVRRVR